ncbi:MAG: hypothetical protein LKJ16_01065 [Lactobacillus delbrueckii]|nr:hypothetical protein [Lactobacillus delbrueckii]MCI1928923.1 hypothetical protein [Lactobacillus delbrueckii]
MKNQAKQQNAKQAASKAPNKETGKIVPPNFQPANSGQQANGIFPIAKL